ncbi:MAG: hypothetical protein R6V05_11810 [Candidatus Brocadiia bacterium]
MRTRRKVVWMLLLGVALAVGLAYAQPAEPRARDRGPQAPAVPHARAARFGGGPLAGLMADEATDVEVELTDEGVELIITTEPERVEELRERARLAAERLETAAARFGERAPEERPRMGRLMRRDRPGLLGLVVRGELDVDVRETDDGVVLSLISDEPEVVERLHDRIPDAVAEARERAERRHEWAERRGGAPGVLADEAVDVQVRETDEGVVIHVTSDDPELADRIREHVPGAFERMREFRARRRERLEGDQPWGPAMMRRRMERGPMHQRGFGPMHGRPGERSWGTQHGPPHAAGPMWGPEYGHGPCQMHGHGPARGHGYAPGPRWRHHWW